jgi:hypothetical protein
MYITWLNNGYSSQNVRGQNRYSALGVSFFPRDAYRFMIMFTHITTAHSCRLICVAASHYGPPWLPVSLTMGLHVAACLSHVPHPKLQWLLPSSRAPTLPNGHSIRVHPRVLRIASCKALIRLKVQRLVIVRPSARSARGNFSSKCSFSPIGSRYLNFDS